MKYKTVLLESEIHQTNLQNFIHKFCYPTGSNYYANLIETGNDFDYLVPLSFFKVYSEFAGIIMERDQVNYDTSESEYETDEEETQEDTDPNTLENNSNITKFSNIKIIWNGTGREQGTIYDFILVHDFKSFTIFHVVTAALKNYSSYLSAYWLDDGSILETKTKYYKCIGCPVMKLMLQKKEIRVHIFQFFKKILYYEKQYVPGLCSYLTDIPECNHLISEEWGHYETNTFPTNIEVDCICFAGTELTPIQDFLYAYGITKEQP